MCRKRTKEGEIVWLFVLWERDARIIAQRREKKEEISAEKHY